MSFCIKYNQNLTDSDHIRDYYSIDKYKSTSINSIEFVNQHSKKDNKLLFTNHLQRSKGQRIDVLKSSISDLLNNPNNLDFYFDGREISIITKADYKKVDRMYNILKLYDIIPEEKQKIIKYAPNKNFFSKYLKNTNNHRERGFQLFYTRENDDVKVYLIDLYHLVIPSKGNNTRREYVDRIDYNKDIYDCVFKEEKVKVTN